MTLENKFSLIFLYHYDFQKILSYHGSENPTIHVKEANVSAPFYFRANLEEDQRKQWAHLPDIVKDFYNEQVRSQSTKFKIYCNLELE